MRFHGTSSVISLLSLCVSAFAQITVTPSGGVNLAAPGPIGGTTPSTGAFTTLSASELSGTPIKDSFGSVVFTPTTSTIQNLNSITLGGGNNDVILLRVAANTLAQRNAAEDQAFRIYGLYTDASNYHYGSLAMSDTALTLSTQTLGTGVDNLDIVLTPSGTGVVSTTNLTATGAVDFSAGTVLLPPFAVPFLLPGSASPTVDAVGEIAYDSDFFAASKGALLWYDGTGVRVVPAYTNAVAPTDGQALVWDNTNKWWEPGSVAGSVATDTIFDAAGDLPVGTGADTAARLVIGGFGDRLVSNGTTAVWGSLSKVIRFEEEFFWALATVVNPWDKAGTWSLTQAIQDFSDASHWGVVRMRSTAVTPAALFTSSESIRLGASTCYFEWIVKTPETSVVGTPAPSDGTNHYTLLIGLGDTPGALAQTDGVYFRYSDDLNGAKWQCACESNTTESIADSGVAFAGAAWIRLGVKITNSASAEFFINGTSVGTITTNIPNGAGRSTGVLYLMNRDVGTAERNQYFDAFSLTAIPSTPR